MRIRSIKPEFWRSDDVNEMTIEDRLLFIGLWSYVDDNGVGIDRHSSICADLFAHDLSVSPHDTLKRVQDGLSRLHSLGVIVRYSVENKDYLEIVNWSKHQKINRPSPGRYPTSDGAKAKTHDPLTDDSVRPHESSLPGTEEQGNRGTGEQGNINTSRKRDEYPEEFEEFWQVYPKRADKRAALKAWEKAVGRATPEEIIAGAEAYRDDPNRAAAFTKNGATWLNADSWGNDPLPPRNSDRAVSFDEQRQQHNNEVMLRAIRGGGDDGWNEHSQRQQLGR